MNAADFLQTLYGAVDTGWLEVTYLVPEGVTGVYPRVAVQWRQLPLGQVDPAMPTVHKLNAQGYGVYFGVGVRREQKPPTWETNERGRRYQKYHRGTQKDALYITALFADVDGGASDENLARVKSISPSIIVKSGGGYHGYLLLDKPLLITDDNREDVKRTLKGIAKFVGSDPHVAELARVLRLPDTVNTKPGRNGARCEVVEANATRYEYADLWMQYAPLIVAPQRIDRHVPIEASEGLPRWVDTYLQNGAPNGERNHRLYAVARAYNDAGLTMGQCANEAGGRARADGLTDEEITRTIESAFAAPRNPQLPQTTKHKVVMADHIARLQRRGA